MHLTKNILLLAVSVVLSSQAFPQLKKSEKQKLIKLLDGTYTELPNQETYPSGSFNATCLVDTSETLKADTTGVHLNTEFVLFRSAIHLLEEKEQLKLFRTNYVSVKEYENFMAYARDSAAREIFYEEATGPEAEKMLKIDKTVPISYKVYGVGDEDKKATNRFYFPLNRDYKLPAFNPSGSTHRYLSQFYLPQAERFYKYNDFDSRMLTYTYYETKNFHIDTTDYRASIEYGRIKYPKKTAIYPQVSIPLYADYFVWGKNAQEMKDEFSVLAQVYAKVYPDSPVMGVNGVQAKAFCHWKQSQLQQALDAKRLPYRVYVSLPTCEDVAGNRDPEPEFTIPARDYTDQWRITVADYKQFTAQLRDSMLREILYYSLKSYEKAAKLITYKTSYFDERFNRMKRIDLSDPEYNRYLFNLNYQTKIDLKDPEVAKIVRNFDSTYSESKLCHSYQYMDVRSRNEKGTFKLEQGYLDGHENQPFWELTRKDYFFNKEEKEMLGKILIVHGENAPGNSNGVRVHHDFRTFFIEMHVNPVNEQLATELASKNPNDLVQNISYEQALSFYHWKYPIQNIKPSGDWQDFVFPTEAQYAQISKGEKVIVPEKRISYPASKFRYVVHVYPK